MIKAHASRPKGESAYGRPPGFSDRRPRYGPRIVATGEAIRLRPRAKPVVAEANPISAPVGAEETPVANRPHTNRPCRRPPGSATINLSARETLAERFDSPLTLTPPIRTPRAFMAAPCWGIITPAPKESQSHGESRAR